MKKYYQIVENSHHHLHAASKARNDAHTILEQYGFLTLSINNETDGTNLFSKIRRQFHFYRGWKSLYEIIENNSIILFQHPILKRAFGKEKILKKCKVYLSNS